MGPSQRDSGFARVSEDGMVCVDRWSERRRTEFDFEMDRDTGHGSYSTGRRETERTPAPLRALCVDLRDWWILCCCLGCIVAPAISWARSRGCVEKRARTSTRHSHEAARRVACGSVCGSVQAVGSSGVWGGSRVESRLSSHTTHEIDERECQVSLSGAAWKAECAESSAVSRCNDSNH